nr:hypothetical protein [Tanacetum cinerariifolium]
MLYHYKLGLAQVEERLAKLRNREVKYYERIRGLELEVEFKTNSPECLAKKLETLKKEKEGLYGKLAGFQTASKDLDSLLESQRLDKNKERLGYSVVPPPPAQLYSPPKKDLSWTGRPEFADDTITDYSRPSPTIESNTDDTNRNSFVSETRESPSIITTKPAIKFVKVAERPTTDKVETAKKPAIKYDKLYRKTTKRLGVKIGRACPKNNNTHKSMPPRAVVYKTVRSPTRTNRSNMNVAQPRRTNFPKTTYSYVRRPFQETTQDLMIILIQRVQRLERELKARTPIQKVYRGRSRPSYFATVSANEFSLLVDFSTTSEDKFLQQSRMKDDLEFTRMFWYTIKKVQGTDSYEFFLANKNCRVDAEVFRKILDICPRVEGEEFTELQNDDDTLTFLRDLSYKGPLHNQAVRVLPDVHQETVDVSKESEPEPEPEPIKRKDASRRVIKKKVTISTDENIILDIDIALELDEINKYKIHVRKDEDKEMLNSKVEDSGKGDAEVSDAAKANTEKTEETKDDFKKAELPPISSSLSISSGFGDQFLKLSSDTSLVGIVKDTTYAEIGLLLDIKIQYERHTTDLIQKYSVKLAPKSSKIQIPIEKSALEILNIKKEQAEKQKMPKYTIKSTNKHHDDDDKEPLARPNKGKKTKRKRTKESESSKKPSFTKETPKGKALSKGSKTGKSAFEKEPVE